MDRFEPVTQLILASASPRRRELLAAAGYEFTVLPPDDSAEADAPALASPTSLVCDLARRKAADVAGRLADGGGSLVLAADTIAECSGEVLGKPADREDARRILQTLSGTRHRVLTGVCLWWSGEAKPVDCWHTESVLLMDPLTDAWLDAYLDSGAWRGKAGAFGYQDGLGFVRIVAGSESNVVGLPMDEVAQRLRRAGWTGSPEQA